MLSHFSRVRLCVTLWTAAHQAPLSMGILQARILEWVAMLSSREPSRPRDQTRVSQCLLYWQLGSLPQAPPQRPIDSGQFSKSLPDSKLAEENITFGIVSHIRIPMCLRYGKSNSAEP